MDRATALRILNEAIGFADARRWSDRAQLRQLIEESNVPAEERRHRLRIALETELHDAELVHRFLSESDGASLAAASTSSFASGTANGAAAVGSTDAGESTTQNTFHANGQAAKIAALYAEFARSLARLESASEAYEMAKDLAECAPVLGPASFRELSERLRHLVSELGGEPGHPSLSRLAWTDRLPAHEQGAPRDAFALGLSEAGTPGALLQQEIDACSEFGQWSRRRQRAQLGVWGGRLRLLRAQGRLVRDQQRTIYESLMRLSRTWRPGHVDAFVLKFEPPCWEDYLVGQQRLLDDAIRGEHHHSASLVEGETLASAIAHLERLMAMGPSRRQLSWHAQVVAQAEHCAELAGRYDVLEPFAPLLLRELVGSDGGRSLLRRVRTLFDSPVESPGQAANTDADSVHPDDIVDGPMLDQLIRILPFTRGRRAIAVGGNPNEAARRRLESAFEFDMLDWYLIGDDQSEAPDSLVRCLRQGGTQVALTFGDTHPPALVAAVDSICAETRVQHIHVPAGQRLRPTISALAEWFLHWGNPDVTDYASH